MAHDLLHQFLKDHDASCPECRYNLRNLTTDRCPECGTPVTLTVGHASEFSWLWLGFLIPFFLMSGSALIFISAHVVYGTPPGPQRFLVAYTYLWLILAFPLLRTRLWFATRTRRTRLILLAASIAHLLAYHLCFIFELKN